MPAGDNWDPHVDRLVADVCDFGQMVASIRECDALVHLAAHRSPFGNPDTVVYADNTLGSYNALSAASALGIERVCLASSINAIGGAFSRSPHYDYFPVDEKHATYTEEAYALSKWVLEQQADSFARRYEWMTIASLRFHWLTESREDVVGARAYASEMFWKHLWAYTLFSAANRAILASLTADFKGSEAFYIAAPSTTEETPSVELAQQYFPNTPITGSLTGNQGFFDCSKAKRLLNWEHE
jgi:UDP-glucose 4-epimerase